MLSFVCEVSCNRESFISHEIRTSRPPVAGSPARAGALPQRLQEPQGDPTPSPVPPGCPWMIWKSSLFHGSHYCGARHTLQPHGTQQKARMSQPCPCTLLPWLNRGNGNQLLHLNKQALPIPKDLALYGRNLLIFYLGLGDDSGRQWETHGLYRKLWFEGPARLY